MNEKVRSILSKSVRILAILIVITLLFWRVDRSGQLDRYSYETKVLSLIDENRSGHEKWNYILQNTQFTDLCTENYAQEFERIGASFIKRANEFDKLKLKEDQQPALSNYQVYRTSFHTYRQIGERLQYFASSVRSGDYEEAANATEQLLDLNNTLPSIY